MTNEAATIVHAPHHEEVQVEHVDNAPAPKNNYHWDKTPSGYYHDMMNDEESLY